MKYVELRLTVKEAHALLEAAGNSCDHPDVLENIFDVPAERAAATRAYRKLSIATYNLTVNNKTK
jgi:hypothetical protein